MRPWRLQIASLRALAFTRQRRSELFALFSKPCKIYFCHVGVLGHCKEPMVVCEFLKPLGNKGCGVDLWQPRSPLAKPRAGCPETGTERGPGEKPESATGGLRGQFSAERGGVPRKRPCDLGCCRGSIPQVPTAKGHGINHGCESRSRRVVVPGTRVWFSIASL